VETLTATASPQRTRGSARRSQRSSALLGAASAISAVIFAVVVQAQAPSRNVVLIVTDGLRWQEFFNGADSQLISRRMGGVGDTARLRREFWRADAKDRRRIVMPFVWDSVAKLGTIWGSPSQNAVASVTNGKKFSYPGYNEMIVGAGDPRIDKNDYGPNPNTTVFEWLNAKPAFSGRTSAIATWGVFKDIFNEKRSGVFVFSGWDPPLMSVTGTANPVLDKLFRTTTPIWDDNALDALMQAALLNHVKAKKPRVLFVGYGETDEWAHSRRYDLTLKSARNVDAFVAELWHTMQAMPEYKGNTTFIFTADHGRGFENKWTDHGEDVDGAERIWIAAWGLGVSARGEVPGNVTQSQIAATIASLLGEDYSKFNPSAAAPLPLRPR
jgi:hypothetical protein